MLFIGQGLRGSNNCRFSGVHTHGVDVFHVTDNDAGIICIPHDLILNLCPAEHAFFNKHLIDAAAPEPAFRNLKELFFCAGNSAAGTAKGVSRADDQGQAEFPNNLFGFF